MHLLTGMDSILMKYGRGLGDNVNMLDRLQRR